MKILQNLLETSKLAPFIAEGFSGFTVAGSDSAADLHTDACSAAEKVLRKGLKSQGNAYNTHGTLNVAMILVEKFKADVCAYGGMNDLAKEVLVKLDQEIKTSDAGPEYLAAMKKFYKQLKAAC